MEIKGANPLSFFSEKQLPPLINSFFALTHLKNLYRQGWLNHDTPRVECESVAEHTFGVAILAMLVADQHHLELDITKLLRMSLIHDMGEVFAGDLTPDSGIDPNEKHRREMDSITKIFSHLQNGEMYINLWEEFDNGKSVEAQIVQQIDKLEMAFQATIYASQNGLDPDEFHKTAHQEITAPYLVQILEILETLQSQGE